MLATAQEKDRWFALNPSSWPDEVLLVSPKAVRLVGYTVARMKSVARPFPNL
jgi:hypothetical protein